MTALSLESRARALIQRDAVEILGRKSVHWDGFGVEVVNRRVMGRWEFEACAPEHGLCLSLDGLPRRVEGCFDGGRIERFELGPGGLFLLPAHRHLRGHLEACGTFRSAALRLEPDLITRASGGDLDASRVALAPAGTIENRTLAEAMTALAREVEQPGLMGRMYAEGLGLVVLAQLVRHHAVVPDARRRANRVASRRFRQVTDFIEAHLGEDLSLMALAAAAGLGPAHFAQQFRRVAGLSPHQYVLRRRVKRAAALLRLSRRSVAEVALEVGFSSQSHLTAAFRRVYGTTPGAYRAEYTSGWKTVPPTIGF